MSYHHFVLPIKTQNDAACVADLVSSAKDALLGSAILVTVAEIGSYESIVVRCDARDLMIYSDICDEEGERMEIVDLFSCSRSEADAGQAIYDMLLDILAL